MYHGTHAPRDHVGEADDLAGPVGQGEGFHVLAAQAKMRGLLQAELVVGAGAFSGVHFVDLAGSGQAVVEWPSAVLIEKPLVAAPFGGCAAAAAILLPLDLI